MTQTVTLTKKGQMTLPKDFQKALGVKAPARVRLSFDKRRKMLKVEHIPSILEFGGKLKAPKGKSALKAREYMETHYYDRR